MNAQKTLVHRKRWMYGRWETEADPEGGEGGSSPGQILNP